MAKKGKKFKIGKYKVTLEAEKKISAAKLEKKKARCECPHRSNGGNYWIKKVKGKKTIWKCRVCGDKVDFAPFIGKSRKELKAYIKETFAAPYNCYNVTKLTMDPKKDGRMLNWVGKQQFNLIRGRHVNKAAIGDSFQAPGKNKKNRNRNNGDGKMKITGGGNSLR